MVALLPTSSPPPPPLPPAAGPDAEPAGPAGPPPGGDQTPPTRSRGRGLVRWAEMVIAMLVATAVAAPGFAAVATIVAYLTRWPDERALLRGTIAGLLVWLLTALLCSPF